MLPVGPFASQFSSLGGPALHMLPFGPFAEAPSLNAPAPNTSAAASILLKNAPLSMPTQLSAYGAQLAISFAFSQA